MQNGNRRSFLKTGGAALAASVAGAVVARAHADEHAGHTTPGAQLKSEKGTDAFTVKASERGVCATCQFWGGVRRVSEDKSTVYCESLGWCNNPESHHYQSKTTPVTGPMDSWKKWEAL